MSLALARDGVPVPVDLRLFLPQAWATDAARCAKAAVPEERQQALAKTEIALIEIDRAAAGARFGMSSGAASPGVRGRRARSWPGSPPCGYARPRENSSGRVAICRARRSGWWAAAQRRRAQVLPVQPACRHIPRGAGRHDQGQMAVRAGAPADEGGTGPRATSKDDPRDGLLAITLAGMDRRTCWPPMDQPAPPRADDHDRPLLPPAPPPQGAGEKQASQARRTTAAADPASWSSCSTTPEPAARTKGPATKQRAKVVRGRSPGRKASCRRPLLRLECALGRCGARWQSVPVYGSSPRANRIPRACDHRLILQCKSFP